MIVPRIVTYLKRKPMMTLKTTRIIPTYLRVASLIGAVYGGKFTYDLEVENQTCRRIYPDYKYITSNVLFGLVTGGFFGYCYGMVIPFVPVIIGGVYTIEKVTDMILE